MAPRAPGVSYTRVRVLIARTRRPDCVRARGGRRPTGDDVSASRRQGNRCPSIDCCHDDDNSRLDSALGGLSRAACRADSRVVLIGETQGRRAFCFVLAAAAVICPSLTARTVCFPSTARQQVGSVRNRRRNERLVHFTELAAHELN